MKAITSALRRLILVACVVGLLWGVASNYSFVFSKKVVGEVIEVERVSQPSAIITGTPMTSEQMFSFAVMIRAFDGKIYSSSSEDRQWAVAKKGYCVESRFFPYPPWDLQNDGTFHNARLVRVFDCKAEAPAGWSAGLTGGTAIVPAEPPPTASPTANPSVSPGAGATPAPTI